MKIKIIKKTFIEKMEQPFDNDWNLFFTNNIKLMANSTWRLLENNQIVLCNSDHGQKYGRENKIDCTNELVEMLRDVELKNIRISENPADIYLAFDKNYEFQCFCASSGFESWELCIENSIYISLGGGELSIFK